MRTFPRSKPLVEREPFHAGQPWHDPPKQSTRPMYEYRPSRTAANHTKSLVTFVNVTSDIDGCHPKARTSKNGREIAGLITTPLRPKRTIVCTDKEKEKFTKTWTQGPPPLTETHGHAIGKGEIRDFIRDSIDISVGLAH